MDAETKTRMHFLREKYGIHFLKGCILAKRFLAEKNGVDMERVTVEEAINHMWDLNSEGDKSAGV